MGRLLRGIDRRSHLLHAAFGAPHPSVARRQARTELSSSHPRAVVGDPLLTVGQQLADAAYDWWRGVPPPIIHRTRSVPAACSIVFTRSCTWTHVTGANLRDARALLIALVTHHGVDVPETWLKRPHGCCCYPIEAVMMMGGCGSSVSST